MTSTSESRTPVWYRLHEHLEIRGHTAPFLAVVLVELRGRLDDRNASVVARTFHEVIGLGATVLHVDLADIESFDGAGARTLAISAAELEAHGGRLRVLNAPGSVERVLEMTGLGRLLIASRETHSGRRACNAPSTTMLAPAAGDLRPSTPELTANNRRHALDARHDVCDEGDPHDFATESNDRPGATRSPGRLRR